MAIFGPKYKDVDVLHDSMVDPRIGWHVYRTGDRDDATETKAQFAKRWKDVHHSLNRFWLWPAVKVLSWYTKKHYKGIPTERQNQLLILWEKAWQDSVTLLYTEYLRNTRSAGRPGERYTREQFEKFSYQSTGHFMRELVKAQLLVALTDTVQSEFLKIFIQTLVKRYFDEFKDSPDFLKHLMYTNTEINDPMFYHMYVCPDSKITQLKASTDLTCCELQAIHGTRNAISLSTLYSLIDAQVFDAKLHKRSAKGLEELKSTIQAVTLTPVPPTGGAVKENST